jgi:hypothetical protein
LIYVSKEINVNDGIEANQPRLNRSQVWAGLVLKAENALPFVPGMAKCDVIERFENGLIRDIVFRGASAREKVTLQPQERVTFVRLGGNADGFIVNEILGPDDSPSLRFSFALQLIDASSGSPAESDFRVVMERDYLAAVGATIAAIRQMVAQGRDAKSHR